jgi:hypothetical protein
VNREEIEARLKPTVEFPLKTGVGHKFERGDGVLYNSFGGSVGVFVEDFNGRLLIQWHYGYDVRGEPMRSRATLFPDELLVMAPGHYQVYEDARSSFDRVKWRLDRGLLKLQSNGAVYSCFRCGSRELITSVDERWYCADHFFGDLNKIAADSPRR